MVKKSLLKGDDPREFLGASLECRAIIGLVPVHAKHSRIPLWPSSPTTVPRRAVLRRSRNLVLPLEQIRLRSPLLSHWLTGYALFSPMRSLGQSEPSGGSK